MIFSYIHSLLTVWESKALFWPPRLLCFLLNFLGLEENCG